MLSNIYTNEAKIENTIGDFYKMKK